MGRIYLDYNATAPMHPEVGAAMAAVLDGEGYGNPSSMHGEGRAARDAVERARGEVAALIGARAEEIVFCSGGTEGDNLAIRGAARAVRARTGRAKVISSRIEHPAVVESVGSLGREGFVVAWAAVTSDGEIAVGELERLVDEKTALVSLATANHEIGNVYAVGEFAAAARRAGALFHTDAVQAAGRIPVDVGAWGVDLATISAHKIGGPKGVGAVYQRRGVEVEPLVVGGHQERGRRPGTENFVGVVGFGEACRVARRDLEARTGKIRKLSELLENGLMGIAGARRFGRGEGRVPGVVNVGFSGVEGDLVVMGLDLEGVAVSTGAACTSGAVEASPVILGLGVEKRAAKEAVRFSIGWGNEGEEIARVVGLVGAIVERARRFS